MRILVIGHNLRVAGGLSVGQNVVTSLARTAGQHEYCLLLPAGAGYEELAQPAHCESHYYRRAGLLSQIAFELRELPALVRRFRPDVVWGLGNFGLAHPRCAQAVLFQNAHLLTNSTFDYRKHHRLTTRALYTAMRWRLARSLPSTQLVFCQTQTMATRFRSSYGYQGRIAVMPNAVSERIGAGGAEVRPDVFGRIGGRRAFLCLTRYYPHKNLEILVETMRLHRDALRDVVVLLTISAQQSPAAEAMLNRIASLGLGDRIINVGPLEQEALGAYFRHSAGLILPTLLESFSATYLEAMRFERPILTSDLDFARETCGEAALYFDPHAPDSVCNTMLKAAGNPGLCEELARAGRERLRCVTRTWDEIVSDAVRELEALV